MNTFKAFSYFLFSLSLISHTYATSETDSAQIKSGESSQQQDLNGPLTPRQRQEALEAEKRIVIKLVPYDATPSYYDPADPLMKKVLLAEKLIYDRHEDKDGNLNKAAKLIESVLEQDPEFPPALVQLSRLIRFNMGHKARMTSREILLKAIELDPGYADAYTHFGWIAAVTGDHYNLDYALMNAITLKTTNPWTHNAKGEQATRASAHSHSKVYYQRTLDMNYEKGDSRAREARVWALEHLMKASWYADEFENTLAYGHQLVEEAHPLDADRISIVGNVFCRANYIDLGLEMHEKALNIGKECEHGTCVKRRAAFCHYIKSAELLTQGEEVQSEVYYDKGRELYNKDPRELLNSMTGNPDIAHLREPFFRKYIIPAD